MLEATPRTTRTRSWRACAALRRTLALGLAVASEPSAALHASREDVVRRSPAAVAAPLLITQVPRSADAAATGATPGAAGELDAARPLPPGSRIVLFDPAQPAREPRTVTADFHSAGRADVRDDAQSFVFVAQRAPGERFQVWEASLAGGEARQVTRRDQDCLEALYLSTMFTIDAPQPQARLCFASLAQDGEPALYTCALDGSDEQRITYLPQGARHPLLLSDGRLLFVSPAPAVSPARPAGVGALLLTVNTDGTDVQAFALPPERVRARPCETPAGRVLYFETGTEPDVDTGRADEWTSVASVSLTRSLRSRTEFAPRLPGSTRALAALADGTFVACWKPAGDPAASFDVCALDPARGAAPVRLSATPAWDEIEAAPVEPRKPRPGRSSVVDSKLSEGLLFCLDVSLGDALGDARGGGALTPGAARVVEIVAATSGAAREETLGSAPIESDGSFYLVVPARRALRLRVLDEQGASLSDMQSWFWVMPQEARGCIGCHEDRERTPPNRFTRALRAPPHTLGSGR